MAPDRETTVEVVVSIVGVGLFIAAVIGIGTVYYTGSLSNTGALALIGAIAGFIVLMAAVAFFLAYR